MRMSQDAPPEEVAAWPEAERHIWVPPAFVPDVYRNVDLFVGPSTEVEGFGLPTIEAMSCGLPSVLTDIGAFRGIDPDARASIRIPVFDAAALQAAVRRLADDSGLCARLGSEGRRIARTYNAGRTGRRSWPRSVLRPPLRAPGSAARRGERSGRWSRSAGEATGDVPSRGGGPADPARFRPGPRTLRTALSLLALLVIQGLLTVPSVFRETATYDEADHLRYGMQQPSRDGRSASTTARCRSRR